MRHRPVRAEHRVLGGAEVRQPVGDEVGQGGLRLGGGDREPARAVATDRVEVEPIQVGADGGVDVVLGRLPRAGDVERRGALRRRLAVLGVVVPGPADRLTGVHQHVEAATLGAVEVLHPERLAVAGPVVERGPWQRERRRREDVGDQAVPAQPLDEGGRRERRRLVHQHRPSDLRQRLPVGAGAQVDGPVAELGRGVAQAGEHEVQFLAVEPAPPEHPLRLHQHHLPVAVLGGAVDVRAELVTKDPQRGIGMGRHRSSLDGRADARASARTGGRGTRRLRWDA